jgi:hypothetical protein
MKHTHPFPRLIRRLLGLPQKRCDPLDYSGGGRINNCIACMLESPRFWAQVEAVRQIAERNRQ